MPKRSSVKKVPTPVEIMGEDAYVIYRPITVQEARDLRSKAGEIEKQTQSALEKYAKENNKAIADLTDSDKDKAYGDSGLTDELVNYADREFSKYILEWNWVDDNDEPMPMPKDDYTVMGKLYPHEYNYIMSLFTPDEQTEKNSK